MNVYSRAIFRRPLRTGLIAAPCPPPELFSKGAKEEKFLL
jgi:hypothetical protein